MAPSREFSTDHFARKMGLFYAAYFFFGGVQLPFFPLFLEARGLDAEVIGLIIAVPMLVRIVATPLISHQADRRRALKATLVIAAVAATLGMTAVGLVSGAVAILIVFVLSAVAFSPIMALADAYALSGLSLRGRAYGPVRLWGSVAFIGGNIGAGLMLHILAPQYLIWLIVGSLTVAVVAAVLLDPIEMRYAPPEQPAHAAPGSVLTLLRNPVFIAVAIASGLVQSSHALYYGFSTMQWRGEGMDGVLIGTLWAIGVAAEVVVLGISGRLPASLGPAALLAIGSIAAVVRWTAMAFDPPVALLPALQLLHAGSFAATHLGLMGFMVRAVPRELAATAQGVVATFSGLVNASATFASGYLYAASGGRAYLLMAAMSLVGLLSALYAGRRMPA